MTHSVRRSIGDTLLFWRLQAVWGLQLIKSQAIILGKSQSVVFLRNFKDIVVKMMSWKKNLSFWTQMMQGLGRILHVWGDHRRKIAAKWINSMAISIILQLNPALTDFKGPINFIYYREKSRSKSSTFWHIREKQGFYFLMGQLRLSTDRMSPLI